MKNTQTVVSNGCVGICCEGFSFPFTKEEIRRNLEARSKGKIAFIREDGLPERVLPGAQLSFIYDMVIDERLQETSVADGRPSFMSMLERYLKKNGKTLPEDLRTLSMGDKLFLKENRIRISADGKKLLTVVFSCRHLDKVNKVCTVYEKRPQMCRDFGVINGCYYKGCCMAGASYKG